MSLIREGKIVNISYYAHACEAWLLRKRQSFGGKRRAAANPKGQDFGFGKPFDRSYSKVKG